MIRDTVSIQGSPPKPLRVFPGGIPDELKVCPQWVNWRYARAGEKWTKHPYDPRSGRKASSTNLLTWSSFDQVLRAYESGDYAGVGFVFCSGDPYVGVDLDGCRDPQTGEIAMWASKIIGCLDSYTEISPSGRGVHVIVRGKMPTPVKRRGVEMYAAERYFTVTGQAA
jgi:putative DNA primase/helicase